METIIVWIIVAGAAAFTVRNLINTYKGKGSCSCGDCSCSSKEMSACNEPFSMDNTKTPKS